MVRRLRRQEFPWRDGNRFQLLVDGGAIFPAMLAAIARAQSQVFLEMYLVESGSLMGQFISALLDASQRGVSICLLFDDYGARGLGQTDRRRLEQAGINVAYYNPLHYGDLRRSLLRDHRKLLVVDESMAFVGGMGITDAFDTATHPEDYWHDAAVQVEGPVVSDWHMVFRTNWRYWARQKLPEARAWPADELAGLPGRVSGGRRFGAAGIQRSFIKRVRSAERQVWMMTAYFVPSRGLLRALRKAARRGVDVRLLLPGPITDHPSVRYAGRRFYHSLLRAGVRIFEYQPRFLHAKLLMCDDWVSLGSCNVDRWNLRWNLEANQEIEGSQFAAHVRELFVTDFGASKECHAQQWQLRSQYRKWQEWFWGRVDWLLEKMSARWLRKLRQKMRRKK